MVILDGIGEVNRPASVLREVRATGGCYIRSVPGDAGAAEFESFVQDLRAIGLEVDFVGREAVVTIPEPSEA